jgi:signal transduction histidine kinase
MSPFGDLPELSRDTESLQRGSAAISTQLARFSTAAGVIVGLVGLCGLAGWILDIDVLKALYGPITMKTNAAIAFVLCGTALVLQRRAPRTGAVCAASAAAIGALTLSEHLFGIDIGIDQLLFVEPPGAAATASPNRMGPNGSISFMLAGLALLLVRRRHNTAARVGQIFAFIGLAFASLAIAGYSYGAVELYGIARFTGIALATAVAFAILHVGILTSETTLGPMAIFASEGAGGTILRRLTLWVIVLPLMLGWLEVTGRRAEYFDRGLGMALLIVSVTSVLLAIVWRTARVIDITDRERRHAREEAVRANRLKDQFIAMLSHELRTPLNVMLGRLRLLETEPDSAGRTRAAAIAARNGRLLARLVEDLLDLSRASAGQFEIAPAPARLNTLVRSTLDTIAPAAAEKGIALTSDLDPALPLMSLDPHRIQQVVLNLLTNAVRFTPSGGRIAVRTSNEPDGITVVVSDTGIGFHPEFAEHMFEPFRQADLTARREYGGLGLGLAIARHLAELHGGSLTGVSAGVGRGATFILKLPAASITESAADGRATDDAPPAWPSPGTSPLL